MATSVGVATAGCTGWRNPTTERSESGFHPYAMQFETVVNLEAAGADTTAGDSIVPLLNEHLADDTMLYLPPGRYKMADSIQLRTFSNVGIVGKDAVIVPPDGFDSTFFDLGRPGQATNLLIAGLTFDFRANDTGSRPISALVDDGLVIRDLAVTGTQDAGSGMLRADVTDPDGSGLVDRLWLPDGAAVGTESNGCLVGDEHRGELRLTDCHIVGFPDNGLYADPEHGRVLVHGGYYANSDIANVRVGNDSVVRGVHIRNDREPDGYANMRGLRLTHGDVHVADTRIELANITDSGGAIACNDQLSSATVENTTITVDADNINAIRAKPPTDDTTDGALTFTDVTIQGTAANRAAVDIRNRTNCQLNRCTITQSGANRDGIRCTGGSTVTLQDTGIDVTGQPVVTTEQSTVRRV